MKKTAIVPVLFSWVLFFSLFNGMAVATQGDGNSQPIADNHGTSNINPYLSWLNYTAVMSEGRFSNKKIMLFFTDNGDMYCEKMQKETFSDPRVIAYISKHFLISRIERRRFPILIKKYKVDAMPTLWFLDSKGKGLTATDGFVPPEQMLLILEFISTELYKETTFKQWKEIRSRK